MATLTASASPHRLTVRENRLQGMVVGVRSTHGRSHVYLDRSLSACARQHAARMSRQHRLFHSDCGSAEVVGQAGSLYSVSRAWWDSDPHRRILLLRERLKAGYGYHDGYWVITFEYR